jgi:RNA polymerase sigma-70 factor (ECF subfamily)
MRNWFRSSVPGNTKRKYQHLSHPAAISAQYSVAPTYEATDWKNILSLYDSLMHWTIHPLYCSTGPLSFQKQRSKTGPGRVGKIKDDPAFKSYHLYYSTQAEFYIEDHDFANAVASLEKAMPLAPLQSEKELLNKKLKFCREKINR